MSGSESGTSAPARRMSRHAASEGPRMQSELVTGLEWPPRGRTPLSSHAAVGSAVQERFSFDCQGSQATGGQRHVPSAAGPAAHKPLVARGLAVAARLAVRGLLPVFSPGGRVSNDCSCREQCSPGSFQCSWQQSLLLASNLIRGAVTHWSPTCRSGRWSSRGSRCHAPRSSRGPWARPRTSATPQTAAAAPDAPGCSTPCERQRWCGDQCLDKEPSLHATSPHVPGSASAGAARVQHGALQADGWNVGSQPMACVPAGTLLGPQAPQHRPHLAQTARQLGHDMALRRHGDTRHARPAALALAGDRRALMSCCVASGCACGCSTSGCRAWAHAVCPSSESLASPATCNKRTGPVDHNGAVVLMRMFRSWWP